MTQAQAIERGFTHFIEVWRDRRDSLGENRNEHFVRHIDNFDDLLHTTSRLEQLYTVAIFLIKPNPTH